MNIVSNLIGAEKMNAAHLVAFHIEANTPLYRLANSVRWFETSAKHASSKFEKNILLAKAVRMRGVTSAVYAHRDVRGEYV